MIPEDIQNQALDHVLQELPAAEAAHIERMLRSDAELREFERGLRESAAALTWAAPPQLPPAHLRGKILSEIQRRPTELMRLPWLTPFLAVLAACLLVGLAGLAYENFRMRAEMSKFRGQVALLLQQNSAAQQKIAELSTRDSLAQVKIATLAAQVTQMSKAQAVIVWDGQKQEGVIQLINMPKADAGKDYQLWVIDPQYSMPISAGVVPVGGDGSVLTAFKPDQPILHAGKFALSVEQAGGVPHGKGPIVFIGD